MKKLILLLIFMVSSQILLYSKNEDASSIINAIYNNDIMYLKKHVNKSNINKIYRYETKCINYCIDTTIDKCTELTTLLHIAIAQGGRNIIKFLIKNGADLNAFDHSKKTPLGFAIRCNKLEVVKILLNYGADPNYAPSNSRTPLFIAIQGKKIKIVNLLIQYGADINKLDSGGYSLLHYVDSPALADFLIKKGLNVNIESSCTKDAYNCNKRTPLHNAVLNGNYPLSELYIKKGANVNRRSSLYQNSALHIALGEGFLDIAYLLIKNKADVRAKNKYGYEPIHIACSASIGDGSEGKYSLDYMEIVQVETILSKNKKSSYFSKLITPNASFYYPPDEEHIKIVKLLVEQGAGVDVKANDSTQPIHYAAFAGNLQIIKYLIEQGAQVDNKTLYDAFEGSIKGETPLSLAIIGIRDYRNPLINYNHCINDRIKILKLLIEKKANVNSQSEIGYTPLHWAIEVGNLNICKILLDRGADPEIKSSYGYKAFDLLEGKKNINIKKILKVKK